MNSLLAVLRTSRKMARKGVTLVELMIVVVIIGVLLGAALPTVLDNIRNREVYDTAREVSQVFKRQRIRAQNFNLAMGVTVDLTNGQVLTSNSDSNLCSGLDNDTVAMDLSTYEDSAITSTNHADTEICIKPDGSVVDPATGEAFANDPVVFEVKRSDGIGNAHRVVVPFNGLARVGQ